MVDRHIAAHAVRAADESAGKAAVIAARLHVDRRIGQLQVAHRSAVCKIVEEARACQRRRCVRRADGHAGDRVVPAVEGTGEGVDRRPLAVKRNVGVQRHEASGIVRALRRGRGKGAQLRFRPDDIGGVLGAVAGIEGRPLLFAEEDLAARQRPGVQRDRAARGDHGGKEIGAVIEGIAGQVLVRRGERRFGNTVVHHRREGLGIGVLRRDGVLVGVVPQLHAADRRGVRGRAVHRQDAARVIVGIHGDAARLIADQCADIGGVLAGGVGEGHIARAVAVFHKEAGIAEQTARRAAVVLRADAAHRNVAQRSAVRHKVRAAGITGQTARARGGLFRGRRDRNVRNAVGQIGVALRPADKTAGVGKGAGDGGDHAALHGTVVDLRALHRARQKPRVKAVVIAAAGLGIDRRAGQVQVLNGRALRQAVEKAGRRAARGRGLRADGHAGNGVAVAVKAAGEIVDGRPRAGKRNVRAELKVAVGRNELAAHRCRGKGAQVLLGADDIGVGLGAVAAVKVVRLLGEIIAGAGRQQASAVVLFPAVPARVGHEEVAVQRHVAGKQLLVHEPRLRGGELVLLQRGAQLFKQRRTVDVALGQALAVLVVAGRIVERVIADRDRLRDLAVVVALGCVAVEVAVVRSRHVGRAADDAADGHVRAVLIGEIVDVQVAVGIAGVDRAGAVAHHAADGAEGIVDAAAIRNIAEGRAVDDGGLVARPAHDAADGVDRVADGEDRHIRPAVRHKAL